VAGDGGGDATGAGAGVLDLVVGCGRGEDVSEGEFEFPALEASWGGFDGEGAGAEGLCLEAVALEFVGKIGEADHLLGEEINQERHEQTLTLGAFGTAFAENLLEEDALVGDVLIDDPEAFVVRGKDEGIAQLAEGFEGGEGVESVG